jgi:thiamine-monophosphate kinase
VTREHAWLAGLGATIGVAGPEVTVGIGDDCAVLAVPGPLVWTVDAQVEGVHFTRALASLADIGFRSITTATSDVAAMGARPVAILSSLIAPSIDAAELDAIVAGQREAATLIGAPIVGGNVSRGAELSITVSVLGATPSPLRRDGAREGDGVWLLGPVGQAAAGLALLQRGIPSDATELAACVRAWRRPTPQIAGGLAVATRASAAIDVSDGLAADVAHLANASAVTVVLDADACIDAGGPALAAACAALGRDPLDLALAGGEDYALVATSRVPLGDAGFTLIGQITGGPPRVQIRRGRELIAPPRGWDHGEQ